MRNISFFLTQEQFCAKSKTVTSRKGWAWLQAGTLLQSVEKGQGLKKGETVTRIGPPIRVLDVSRVPLTHIDQDDVRREGFPDMTPQEFIDFYARSNKLKVAERVMITRIEFEYVEGGRSEE